MRGMYTASVKISGLAAAKTLLYITVPANKVVELHNAFVTNCNNETSEQIEVKWSLVNALGTPTGTTLTPAKHEQGDQAAGSTVVGNVTASEPTYVSNTDHGYQGVPSLSGYVYTPTPEERIVLAGGATWGLRLISTPTSFDAIVSVTFREMG